MRHVWVVLLVLVAAGSVRAEARHGLGIGVGLRAATQREDLLVPLAFSGPGLRLDVRYAWLAGPGLLTARLELGMRTQWNRFGHFGAGIDHGVEAAWLVRIREAASWRAALGPALAHQASVNYLPDWDDAHGYWLGAQWLGITGRIVRGLGPGSRLEVTPTVALIGFRSRPPAYRYDKQDALTHVGWWVAVPTTDETFVTAADLQIVRLDVAFRARSVHDSDAAGGWSFGIDSRLQRTDGPATLIALESVFYAAHAWEWP